MKIHQLITLLALCLVLSLALQDVNGKKKNKQPINNSVIKNGQLATIQLKVNSLSDSLPLCSGLMIAPHLVLARANCLIILSTGAAYAHQLHKQKHVIPPMIHPSLLTISVNSTEKKVKLVEFHEHFNLFTLDHNMALILLQSNEEDANKILNRELQQVMEDMEKRGVENLKLGQDNVKVLLPNLEIIESGECSLADSNPSMNCRQISVSGEDEFSFEDSFLFQKSNQKDEWFPIGIETFHENQPRQARVYFSPINKQTLKWFHKVSKKLNEKVEKESIEGQTYHFSPVPNDKRFEIMAEMRHRLRQIINPDEEPTPQSNVLRAATTPATFNSAYSHNLYETENNLKEISRQLHSKLVNTIMGKKEEL